MPLDEHSRRSATVLSSSASGLTPKTGSRAPSRVCLPGEPAREPAREPAAGPPVRSAGQRIRPTKTVSDAGPHSKHVQFDAPFCRIEFKVSDATASRHELGVGDALWRLQGAAGTVSGVPWRFGNDEWPCASVTESAAARPSTGLLQVGFVVLPAAEPVSATDALARLPGDALRFSSGGQAARPSGMARVAVGFEVAVPRNDAKGPHDVKRSVRAVESLGPGDRLAGCRCCPQPGGQSSVTLVTFEIGPETSPGAAVSQLGPGIHRLPLPPPSAALAESVGRGSVPITADVDATGAVAAAPELLQSELETDKDLHARTIQGKWRQHRKNSAMRGRRRGRDWKARPGQASGPETRRKRRVPKRVTFVDVRNPTRPFNELHSTSCEAPSHHHVAERSSCC